MSEQQNHVLERTSRKGELFIGTCILCGTAGLTSYAALELCSNPQQVSTDDAVVAAITGEGVAPSVNLHDEFDASVWAREFCRLNLSVDEGLMLGWFANAIMAGSDHAQRAAEAELLRLNGPVCPFDQLRASEHETAGESVRLLYRYWKADQHPLRHLDWPAGAEWLQRGER